MNSVLTEPSTDLFESLFTADGTWVLIDQNKAPSCVGTFLSQQEAETFRNSYLAPSYRAVQITDPEDVARQHYGKTAN